MKVLHVLIGNMNNGGIEMALMQIFRNIDKNNFEFDFVVHDEEENYYEKEIINGGGWLHRVPYFSRNPVKHIIRFYTLLKNHKEYRIIHIHTTYSITFIDAIIAKKLHRKVIVHSHNSTNHSLMRRIIHYILKNIQSRNSDFQIACSTIAATWMFPLKYKNKIYLWKNPICLEPFRYDGNIRSDIRKHENIENELVVVNVGRLSKQKNQLFLLEIFSKLLQINSNCRLWLVGNGEDRELLETKCKNFNMFDKVTFFGNVCNVNQILQAADVFCFPSLYEGLPLSLIEAQCSGIHILANENITKEVVFAKNFLVDSLNTPPECWARKIMELNREKRSDNIPSLEIMGFCIEKEIKNLQCIYMQL